MKVRKIRNSKRMDVDQIITGALRGGSKTSEELRKAVLERGVTYSTFRRHLNKLVKQGEVKPPKYELGETSIEEADEKEVFEHLKLLREAKNSAVLAHRINRLSSLASSKRMSHIPNVLKFCEDALLNPQFQDKETRSELAVLLANMLKFESSKKPPNHQKIIERIQGEPLKSIIKISQTETDYVVLYQIISFFELTDKEESVTALFGIIERINDDLYERLEHHIKRALFESGHPLRHIQKQRIIADIDKLLKSDNPRTRKRGTNLRKVAFR